MKLEPTVPVFLFTNRNILPEPQGINPFGNERDPQLEPHLAIAEVAIGENVTPQVLLQETLGGPKKKKSVVELKGIEILEAPKPLNLVVQRFRRKSFQNHPWTRRLLAELDQSQAREIVIFVHGYNTHLIKNTELMAEIHHFRGRDGVVINFEWPSRGKLLGYFQDKGNAEQSTRYLRGVLATCALETNAKAIRIIGHSAGCPIVVNALRELRLLEYDLSPQELQEKFRIKSVVLAAPDMDLMAFFNAVLDRFYDLSEWVGVYSAPEDRALEISSKIFGNIRLGAAIGRLTDEQSTLLSEDLGGLEMIDVTYPEAIYGDILGHGYFQNDPWVSSDIGTGILGFSPEERGLVRQPGEIFWEFPPDYPERVKRLFAGAE
ncbi:MAG: alpha/beta hydrolase [Verrucomicrobiota bacterium]